MKPNIIISGDTRNVEATKRNFVLSEATEHWTKQAILFYFVLVPLNWRKLFRFLGKVKWKF